MASCRKSRSACLPTGNSTPSLQQQERINREHLRISVVNALATRLGLDAERDMRPQILATIAFAPLDAAMFSWFGNRSSEEVGHLLDEALTAFVRERDAMCAAISKTGKARAAAIRYRQRPEGRRH